MKLTNRTCLLMCPCAVTFVWQSDASMAQEQLAPEQYETLEIIPYRNSGSNPPFHIPLAQVGMIGDDVADDGGHSEHALSSLTTQEESD